MSELKRTPLRDFHAARGGRLVDFAGWEMPVQYKSILEEHKAVRRAAGLFDVSHMGEVDVRGPEAGKFLNHLVTNDVAKLFPGRVLYSPMCYPSGGVVDDLLVYMWGPVNYFLCINAGNIAKDLAWIREQAAGFAVAFKHILRYTVNGDMILRRFFIGAVQFRQIITGKQALKTAIVRDGERLEPFFEKRFLLARFHLNLA